MKEEAAVGRLSQNGPSSLPPWAEVNPSPAADHRLCWDQCLGSFHSTLGHPGRNEERNRQRAGSSKNTWEEAQQQQGASSRIYWAPTVYQEFRDKSTAQLVKESHIGKDNTERKYNTEGTRGLSAQEVRGGWRRGHLSRALKDKFCQGRTKPY